MMIDGWSFREFFGLEDFTTLGFCMFFNLELMRFKFIPLFDRAFTRKPLAEVSSSQNVTKILTFRVEDGPQSGTASRRTPLITQGTAARGR